VQAGELPVVDWGRSQAQQCLFIDRYPAGGVCWMLGLVAVMRSRTGKLLRRLQVPFHPLLSLSLAFLAARSQV
jgi:hypothetical protein